MDEGGGAYVGEAEKNELMESGVEFPIVGVETRPNPFEEGEQYVVKVLLDDGEGSEEERLLTFTAGSVESRDRRLEALREYLGSHDEQPLHKLEQVGRSILLRGVQESEKPAPRKAATRGAPKKSAARRTAAKPAAKKTAAKPAAKKSIARTTTRGRKR